MKRATKRTEAVATVIATNTRCRMFRNGKADDLEILIEILMVIVKSGM